ncbi:C4-dicarboxylate ABC transporter substrate-binding protein [Psychromonas marina]|uniref:C4-dicarboxylate ABC transporter substrate-binding protein n=2 Tax=Psychromonas marina TaxID=88364 RepID=A0ABQ6E3Y3_9GAMM|nr:C4-dicarboxylate ABC transporter substrate-binding protein [Psychromonas marina]
MQAKEQYLTIGTGGITGVYYPMGGAICHLANQLTTGDYHCEIRSTLGSIYNLEGVRSGELTLGISQSDWQYHAYQGSSRYQAVGDFPELRSLFSVHAESFTVLARADSDIDHFDDLKGKRVNFGTARSGQRATMEVLLNLYQWQEKDFQEVLALNPSEQAKALCNDKVDAIIYVVGHPNPSIKEASGACQTKLVNVFSHNIDKLIAETSYYRRSVIPGGMYLGSPMDTETFGVSAVITTTLNLPEEVAYQLVKSVFENHDEFVQLHPAFELLTKQSMIFNAMSAPLHEGAIRYYKEVGLLPIAVNNE